MRRNDCSPVGNISKTVYCEEYERGASCEPPGRTITESDIVRHAGQIGDFFLHHVDAKWSRTNEFGRRIAHGTLILGIRARMTATEINPVSSPYGSDRVRFIRPVFIGDTIRDRRARANPSVHS